jgi:hypothetical protein
MASRDGHQRSATVSTATRAVQALQALRVNGGHGALRPRCGCLLIPDGSGPGRTPRPVSLLPAPGLVATRTRPLTGYDQNMTDDGSRSHGRLNPHEAQAPPGSTRRRAVRELPPGGRPSASPARRRAGTDASAPLASRTTRPGSVDPFWFHAQRAERKNSTRGNAPNPARPRPGQRGWLRWRGRSPRERSCRGTPGTSRPRPPARPGSRRRPPPARPRWRRSTRRRAVPGRSSPRGGR